ncbi:MAG TPA: SBBP repeat-containing protein, partial [Thermoanaerobaculia bacterium]|nr:SBBP repeat-containing protein [Thermoanaerobaculia bacterium]
MIPRSFCTRRPSFVRLAGLLLVSLLIPSALVAQPSRSWAVPYNEGGFEVAGCAGCADNFLGFKAYVRGRQALAADAAGNTYVTGVTTAGATEDVLTVKYNSQGVVQWAVTYDGGDADQGFAVAVDSAGNVYVAGRSWTETQYGLHGYFLVVKYNASGVQQWATWDVQGVLSAGFAVAVDGSGNVYVAGEYYSGNSDLHTMITVKLNAAGAIQWSNGAFYGYD